MFFCYYCIFLQRYVFFSFVRHLKFIILISLERISIKPQMILKTSVGRVKKIGSFGVKDRIFQSKRSDLFSGLHPCFRFPLPYHRFFQAIIRIPEPIICLPKTPLSQPLTTARMLSDQPDDIPPARALSCRNSKAPCPWITSRFDYDPHSR